MHSMFIEMHIVLFGVALAKLCVLTNDRAEIRIHLLEAAQWIMLEFAVDENFSIHAICNTFVDIQADCIARNILVLKAKILKNRFAGAENMPFLFILRIVIVCQRIL